MAAIVRNNLVIASLDPGVTSVLLDGTTTIGVKLELAGVAVAATAATCVVYYGSTSVTLTPSIAVTGEVSASLTAGNLTTLGVQVFGQISAKWDITVNDGSSRPERYEQLIVVSDRRLRWAVLYDDIKARIPQLRNAAAVPSGQTNYWPQCRLALRDLETELRLLHGDVVLDRVISTEQMRPLAEWSCVHAVLSHMALQDNGQSGLATGVRDAKTLMDFWRNRLNILIAEKSASWTAEQTPGSTRALVVQRPSEWAGQYQDGGVI